MIVKHGLAFVKNGKVLAVKKRGLDVLIMPGGKPEEGESFRETLTREISEELNGLVSLNSVEFFGTFRSPRPEKPEELVHTELYLGKILGSIGPASEIEGIHWIDSKTDPKLLSPLIRDKILPALVHEGHVK